MLYITRVRHAVCLRLGPQLSKDGILGLPRLIRLLKQAKNAHKTHTHTQLMLADAEDGKTSVLCIERDTFDLLLLYCG